MKKHLFVITLRVHEEMEGIILFVGKATNEDLKNFLENGITPTTADFCNQDYAILYNSRVKNIINEDRARYESFMEADSSDSNFVRTKTFITFDDVLVIYRMSCKEE